MKNLKKISLAFLFIGLSAMTFAQPKWLSDKLKSDPPAEGEAIIKMYSDKERTKEITAIADGATMLYFRAYIWKERTKKGQQVYLPMGPTYCFELSEGKFPVEDFVRGADFAGIEDKVETKSLKSYVETNDYIDVDVDLVKTRFLDKFAKNAEKKKYTFTARLSGDCKFYLAQSYFEVDFTNGIPKYEAMLLAANDDLEIPREDLYANDTKLHEKSLRLIASVYGYKEIKDLCFYKEWMLASNGTERKISAAFTSQEDGKCYLHYVKVWEGKDVQGRWMLPNAVNQLVTNQINCSKLE